MDIFEQIAYRLKDTFKYFKNRTKKEFEGQRFEEWVVSHSNIQKISNIKEERAYWRLLEWRGDKYVDSWYPLSNLAPDLVLECVRTGCKEKTIAVECKYRNKEHNFGLKKEQILNYESFHQDRMSNIDAFYYVFGFGWQEKAPKEIYIIPSTTLYSYNKEDKTIRFLHSKKDSEELSKEAPWYEKYRVYLDPKNGKKFLQYKSDQL